MKKIVSIFTLIVLILSLTSCGNPPLPDEFNADEVTTAAKEVIDVVNTKDYVAIVKLFRDDLEPEIDAGELEEVWGPVLDTAGDFIDYTDIELTGAENEDMNYGTVIIECEYEYDNLIYTISFDENMEMAGLYMK